MPVKGKPKRSYAYRPTDEHRRLVEAVAGFGIPQVDICRLIINPITRKPITERTLRRNFREELNTGEVKANSQVVGNLFKTATGRGPGHVTAAIFWAKTRLKWKDRDPTELTEIIVHNSPDS